MNIMIDLETMGNVGRGAIVQIGYAIFDDTGDIHACENFNVTLESCFKVGLRVHGDTIAWWLKQSDAARFALLPNAMAIQDALLNLSRAVHKDMLVWAYPSSFDLSILEAAYDACCVPVPWDFRRLRDARTFIAQVMDRSELVKESTAHVASEDCKNQIRWLVEARRRLNLPVFK